MCDFPIENNSNESDLSSDNCWSEVDRCLDVNVLKSLEEIEHSSSETESSESDEHCNDGIKGSTNSLSFSHEYDTSNILKHNKHSKRKSSQELKLVSSPNSLLRKELGTKMPSSDEESVNSSSSDEKQHVEGDDHSSKTFNESSHNSLLTDHGIRIKEEDKRKPILQLDERFYEQDKSEAVLHYEDITSDDDVWLIHCPKTIHPRDLHHRKFSLDQPSMVTLKSGQDVKVKPSDALEMQITCVLPSVNEKIKYKAVTMNLAGQLAITENIEVPEVNIPDVKRSKVPFPPNLKIRHPLFGVDYKEDIKRGQTYLSSPNIIQIHKKKRTNSDGVNYIVNDSAELPKHKHKISLSADNTYITDANNSPSENESGLSERKRKKIKKNKLEKNRTENYANDNSINEIECRSSDLSKSLLSNKSVSSEDSVTSSRKKHKDKKKRFKNCDNKLDEDTEFGSPLLNSTKFVNTNICESSSLLETTNDTSFETLTHKQKKKKKKHKSKSRDASESDNIVNKVTTVVKLESETVNLTLGASEKNRKRKLEDPVLSPSISENVVDYVPKKKKRKKLYKIRYSSLDEGASLSHL